MKFWTQTSAATFLGFFIALPVSFAETGGHQMVSPDDLTWGDVSSLPAGAKLAVLEGVMSKAAPFTVRIKLPANYKLPAHWHPTIERVTVLSGTFHMGMGDKFNAKKTHPLKAGSLIVIQPKTTHFAMTNEEVVVQLNGVGPWGINYVNPSDDPRKQ